MADSNDEQTEDEFLAIEITDEALEAAASTTSPAAYTQFGLCTISACPGNR